MMRFSAIVRNGQLESVHEPQSYRGCRIFWRGYITNPEDILSEAKNRGFHVEDGTPGDLFVLAYRMWSHDIPVKVTGEYAIAIFDTERSKIFLTHDTFGLVPLFYGRLGGEFIFGSHLEDVIRFTGIRDLDEEFIADYIAQPGLVSTRTVYRDISRLAAGSSLVSMGREEKEFRHPRISFQEMASWSGEDYDVRFLSLLDAAVKGCAPESGNVWCELSGGLDSSTVFSIAAKNDIQGLGAFSILYEEYGEADEVRWIGTMLDMYPRPWHRLHGDHALPYSEIPDQFCAEPGLYMADWAGRRAYEDMASRNGVRAVLTGQGGDLVFFGMGGQPYYLADLAKKLKFRRLFHEMNKWRTHDRRRRSGLYWLTNYVMKPIIARSLEKPIVSAWHREPSPWLNGEYCRRMSMRERGQGRPALEAPGIESSWFLEQLAVLCGHISAINQIPRAFEFRHPLLYRPLVEFMMSSSPDMRQRPDEDRVLQRRALSGILPDEIRLRKTKTIYDQPCYEGLRQGAQFVRLLTDNPRIAERGIVDYEPWIEAVKQARLGRTHFLPQFEAAATLEIWLRSLEKNPVISFDKGTNPL